MTEHDKIMEKQEEILDTLILIKDEQNHRWNSLYIAAVLYATISNLDKIIALFK